jgi:hypothetical protein
MYKIYIEKDSKLYTADSKKKLQSKILKEYRTKEDLYLYEFCKERIYCGFCDRPAKLVIKYHYDEDGNCTLYNSYKPKCCGSTDCPSYSLNGRSYEWKSKAYDLSMEEIRKEEQSIGFRSAKTRQKKYKNSNVYSKQYWLDKGLSEEEAQTKVNSRNRRRPEFWLNRGYKETNAKNMARFHADTFKLEYLMYFKGYDKKEAEEIIEEHRKIMSNSSKTNINTLDNLRKGSKEADDFFRYLYNNILKKYISEDLIYTESFGKKKEWFCNDGNNIYFYDFCIPELDLVIEYHGVHVHPKDKNCDDWKHAYSKEDSLSVWNKDQYKKNLIANKFGFTNYFCLYSDDNKEEFVDKIETTIGKFLSEF